MPRGGFRRNSGRPKGSKDKVARVRRSYAALPDPAGLTVAQASAIFVSRRGQALEDAIYAGDDLRLQAEWFRWRASFAWGIPKKDASELEAPPEALPEIRPPALDPIHQRLADLGVRAH